MKIGDQDLGSQHLNPFLIFFILFENECNTRSLFEQIDLTNIFHTPLALDLDDNVFPFSFDIGKWNDQSQLILFDMVPVIVDAEVVFIEPHHFFIVAFFFVELEPNLLGVLCVSALSVFHRKVFDSFGVDGERHFTLRDDLVPER